MVREVYQLGNSLVHRLDSVYEGLTIDSPGVDDFLALLREFFEGMQCDDNLKIEIKRNINSLLCDGVEVQFVAPFIAALINDGIFDADLKSFVCQVIFAQLRYRLQLIDEQVDPSLVSPEVMHRVHLAKLLATVGGFSDSYRSSAIDLLFELLQVQGGHFLDRFNAVSAIHELASGICDIAARKEICNRLRKYENDETEMVRGAVSSAIRDTLCAMPSSGRRRASPGAKVIRLKNK